MKKSFGIVTLFVLFITIFLSFAPFSTIINAAYVPPANNRVKINFNYDWRFCRQDLISKGIHPEALTYVEDASWKDVSLPHTFNDVDKWREWCNTAGAASNCNPVESTYFGKVWYRKHFTIDSSYSGRKVVLEFQAITLVANFYVNGQWVSRYESGVDPYGLDITNYVNFGSDNLIAIEVNNNPNYSMIDYGGISIPYGQPFNPNYGGINRDVTLHIFDKLYQTLPLYRGLGTQGTYVYAQNIDTLNKTATITMQAEVRNEKTTSQAVTYNAVVVDWDGNAVLTTSDVTQTVNAGQTVLLKATANMTNIHFWSPEYPYLYKVYTSLKVNGTAVDVCETPLGVRTMTFSGIGGLHLNGHDIFLKGYAPRTTMEWPCMGIPPDWLVEYDFKMMHESNANFCRPMHMSPRKVQVEAADKFGIIMTVPSVAGENQPTTWDPNEWQFRIDCMRNNTIYFRNNPSVLFYEGNNGDLYASNMTDMVNVRKTWDPYGGRLTGTRATNDDGIREYGASMDGITNSSVIPHWDAEFARGECPRRIWDDYTPILNPRYNTTDPSWSNTANQQKYVTGGYYYVSSDYHYALGPDNPNDGNSISHYPTGYFRLMNSEELIKENLAKYYGRYLRSQFGATYDDRAKNGVFVGGAKIFWADSTTDGRMVAMEVARVSGLVDGARLPKELFYAMQVAQNDKPQIYVVGHWNYPAGTVKPVYVVSNTDTVTLTTYDSNGTPTVYNNGVTGDAISAPGPVNEQKSHYIWRFDNVVWKSGSIKAVGYNNNVQVVEHQKFTAGAPAKIKLTPTFGPEGAFRADGNDIAMIDVEVVDANGNRCPTYEDRIDFTCSGQGVFLGGYNGGIRWSTNKDNLTTGYHFNVECGINRVFVRATRTAGAFTLNATGSGLTSASVTINSTSFTVTNGLTTTFPQKYSVTLGPEPTPVKDVLPTPGVTPSPTPTNAVMVNMSYTGAHSGSAQLISNAQNGLQVYMDNSSTFSGLPSYLIGGDYIRAYMSDAMESSSTDQYQFTLAKYAYIYQLIDAANDMPVHNYNDNYQWQLMPETVTINNRTMKIYRSRVMGPGEEGYFATNLHGVTNYSPSCNMYVVFAVSLEQMASIVAANASSAVSAASQSCDGNTGTRWESTQGVDPQWIYWDLGSNKNLARIAIEWETASAANYTIDGSTDTVNWTTLATVTNSSQTNHNTITTSIAGLYRYVRMYGTKRTTGYGYSIWETRIYVFTGSAPNPTPTPTGAVSPTPTRSSTPTVSSTPVVSSTPTSTPTPTLAATPTPTATAGGTLLSQGMTASASTYQTGNGIANGNDGNMSTRWAASSGTFPQWWMVDLGSNKSLTRVDINWLNSSSRAYKYKIETSTDNVTFATNVDKTGNTAYADTSDSFTATARYVRITVTGCSAGGAYASAYEFKVYGN